MDLHDLVRIVKEVFVQYDLSLVLAGILSTYITGWIKTFTGWKQKSAFALAIVSAGVLALASAWVQGQIANIDDISRNFIAIFTVAQIFYNGIVYKKAMVNVSVRQK